MAYLLHALIMHAVPVLLCIKKKKTQRESHVTRRDKTFSTGRNNRGSSATNPTLVRLHCVYGFQPKKRHRHTQRRGRRRKIALRASNSLLLHKYPNLERHF